MGNKAESVRQTLDEAIRRCRHTKGLDREGIVTELNTRLGLPWTGHEGCLIRKKITVTALNEITRSPLPGHGASLPAEWVPELCEVLGDDELALVLLPDHLKEVLSIGEMAIKSHGVLARALSELEKIVDQPAGDKPGEGEEKFRRKSGRPAGKTANRP